MIVWLSKKTIDKISNIVYEIINTIFYNCNSMPMSFVFQSEKDAQNLYQTGFVGLERQVGGVYLSAASAGITDDPTNLRFFLINGFLSDKNLELIIASRQVQKLRLDHGAFVFDRCLFTTKESKKPIQNINSCTVFRGRPVFLYLIKIS